METETTPPTTAATTATEIIEPFRRMLMTSPPQRIFFDADEVGGVVAGGRIRPAAFRVRLLRETGREQERRERVVSLVAPRLVIDPVFLLALLRELFLHRPG